MRRLALALVLLGALPASAEVLLTSKAPYWKVGPRDVALSKLCGMGRFNVAAPERWTARFIGKEGAETLVVAKGTGENLRDPDKKAKPKEDYFFRNHGTTDCEVFVGGRKGAG
jgi:hypothetical protein